MSPQRYRNKRFSEVGAAASSVYSNAAVNQHESSLLQSQVGGTSATSAAGYGSAMPTGSLSYSTRASPIPAYYSDDRIAYVASNSIAVASKSSRYPLLEAASARATTFSTSRMDASSAIVAGIMSTSTMAEIAVTTASTTSPFETQAVVSTGTPSTVETAVSVATVSTSGLSTSGKAIVGGVVGGLGGLGLICALVLVLMYKGNKRRRPLSAERLNTPQRFDDKHSSFRSSLPPSTPSRMRSTLTLVSSARQRSRKNSEPPSPSTPSGFQVISGRRLSSPPHFDYPPGIASRPSTSTTSSPLASPFNTPSRKSRLGGTPTVYRDPIGRSQELGSTASHTSRFIEAIGADD